MVFKRSRTGIDSFYGILFVAPHMSSWYIYLLASFPCFLLPCSSVITPRPVMVYLIPPSPCSVLHELQSSEFFNSVTWPHPYSFVITMHWLTDWLTQSVSYCPRPACMAYSVICKESRSVVSVVGWGRVGWGWSRERVGRLTCGGRSPEEAPQVCLSLAGLEIDTQSVEKQRR